MTTRRILSPLLVLLVVLAAGCSSEKLPLDAEAARQLDIANNAIADLTSEGAEDVPRDELLEAVLRAQGAGTTLRVVVTDAAGEFIPAKAVVDRYGGTAISYQANRAGFEGASRDMSSDQLDRAIDAAKVEQDIGESASAFVGVIESEGLEGPGISVGRTLLWGLLILAAAFMLSGAWSFWQARKRRLKRQRDFSERHRVLRDWAAKLGPEVEAIEPLAISGSGAEQQSLQETKDFVATIVSKLDEATSQGELDAAEMRIGRTAIKLRDLRRSLET